MTHEFSSVGSTTAQYTLILVASRTPRSLQRRFVSLPNDPHIAHRPLMDELAQRPTLDETTAAINKLSSGKAAGPDATAAEIYKYAGINLTKSLVKLFINIWDSRAVPQKFKDAAIVHIYKRKGGKSICDDHRGISLLCIAGNILTRILLNRLSLHLADNVLPDSQCGFRAQRSTIDMIFAARHEQEKCREQNLDLYIGFVYLTKAFDAISRDGQQSKPSHRCSTTNNP